MKNTSLVTSHGRFGLAAITLSCRPFHQETSCSCNETGGDTATPSRPRNVEPMVMTTESARASASSDSITKAPPSTITLEMPKRCNAPKMSFQLATKSFPKLNGTN